MTTDTPPCNAVTAQQRCSHIMDGTHRSRSAFVAFIVVIAEMTSLRKFINPATSHALSSSHQHACK